MLDWVEGAAWLDFSTFFPFYGQPISGHVEFQVSDEVWKAAKAREAANPKAKPYCVRVAVYPSGVANSLKATKPAWRSELLPIKQGRIWFTIPPKTLPAGTYTAVLAVISPDGKDAERIHNRLGIFGNTYEQSPTVRFTVRPAIANPDAALKTTVNRTAKPLFHTAIEIGNPNKERFSKDDGGDCYARGVKTLHEFQGRLFIGCGDWGANRGPIDVWSYHLADERTGETEAKFVKEFTVDDESIDRFRTFGEHLYLPGIDAREDFSFGNLYVRRHGEWKKQRNIPGAVHVLDVAMLDDTLYVGTGNGQSAGLWASRDDGKTWTRCGKGDDSLEEQYAFRYYGIVPFQGGILAFDQYVKQGPFYWKNSTLSRIPTPLFGSFRVNRDEASSTPLPFKDGILYASLAIRNNVTRVYVFYLTDLKQGGHILEPFWAGDLASLSVQDGVCYLMSREKSKDGTWHTVAYSSNDLHTWEQLGEATLPGPPTALAKLKDKFYIGLGSDGTNPTSGSIWRLE
jgi:hypothetical protein